MHLAPQATTSLTPSTASICMNCVHAPQCNESTHTRCMRCLLHAVLNAYAILCMVALHTRNDTSLCPAVFLHAPCCLSSWCVCLWTEGRTWQSQALSLINRAYQQSAGRHHDPQAQCALCHAPSDTEEHSTQAAGLHNLYI